MRENRLTPSTMLTTITPTTIPSINDILFIWKRMMEMKFSLYKIGWNQYFYEYGNDDDKLFIWITTNRMVAY